MQTAVDGLTEEQHAIRLNGIGASEAASILGRSKYAGPFDIWNRKVKKEKQDPTDAMEWGNLLEPAILTKFERVSGLDFQRKPDTRFSDEYPHVLATPDGDGDDFVVDAKALRFDRLDEFGAEGSDEVPDDYLIQLTVQMGVFKRRRGHLAVLFGGNDFRRYRVDFNPVLWTKIGMASEEFWSRHVVTATPPGPDATEAYSRYLSELFANRKTDTIREATDEEVKVMREFRILDESAKKLKERIKFLKNTLTAAIGENYGLRSDDGKVLRTGGNKESDTIDWHMVSREFLDPLPEEVRQRIINRHTNREPSTRSLRPYWKKEK